MNPATPKAAIIASVLIVGAVPVVLQAVAPQTLPPGLTFGWADITRLLEVAGATYAVGKWMLVPHLRAGVRAAIAEELASLVTLKDAVAGLEGELKEATATQKENTAELGKLRTDLTAASLVAGTLTERVADLKLRITRVEDEQDETDRKKPSRRRSP